MLLFGLVRIVLGATMEEDPWKRCFADIQAKNGVPNVRIDRHLDVLPPVEIHHPPVLPEHDLAAQIRLTSCEALRAQVFQEYCDEQVRNSGMNDSKGDEEKVQSEDENQVFGGRTEEVMFDSEARDLAGLPRGRTRNKIKNRNRYQRKYKEPVFKECTFSDVSPCCEKEPTPLEEQVLAQSE